MGRPGGPQVNVALAKARTRRKARNTKGVLVAEGDSWFDLPSGDLLDRLDQMGYKVLSVAKHGDTIESMAYNVEQLNRFCDLLVRVGTTPPRAILISGGGNDLAGDRLALLLKYRKPEGSDGLDDIIVARVMERIKSAYRDIIVRITDACEEAGFNRNGFRVPILIHGYAYPVPDGRGYGGWFFLPGPWLKPGLEAQGYTDSERTASIVRCLMDKLHDALESVVLDCCVQGIKHVYHLDLRKCLKDAEENDDHKGLWSDEMHPTAAGFRVIAEVFDKKIQELQPQEQQGNEAE